jgi:phosphatidylserine/phosphatidylglycerophosphate/cardiolipin synthase-like enzyme
MSDISQPDSPATEHRHPMTRDDLHIAIVDLFAQARREIVICSPALDPAIYNRITLTDALGHFIARLARCRVRIVVEDTEHMLLSSVRLVELARRFSDKILIQRLGEPHHGLTEMFIVADSESCLFQQDLATIDATLDLHAPHLALPLARRFEDIWAASEPAPGLHNFRL